LVYEILPEYPVLCAGMNGSGGLGAKFPNYTLVFYFWCPALWAWSFTVQRSRLTSMQYGVAYGKKRMTFSCIFSN